MNLNFLAQDFKDILLLLKKYDVRYIVVGAWALGAHGLPRATADFDIFIERSEQNSKNMVNSLLEFGVPAGEIDRAYFTKDVLFQMGMPPMKLDVFTMISGVTFKEAYENKEDLKFDNIIVPCMSLVDLIKNKRAAGRPKDLLDVEIILKRYPDLEV